MATPMIYQNSRDAQAAGAENGMDNEATEPTPNADALDGQGQPETDGEQATPQEQQQYDDLVSGGMTLLYADENAALAIAKKIKSQTKEMGVAAAIGQHTALIMLQLTRGLKQQGLQPDPDVVLNAGVEILAEVAEIAQQVPGLLPNDQYDKVIEEASYEASRYYGEQELKDGSITPEMQKQAQEVVSANMPKDKGSLAGMAQQQPQQPQQQQQPPQGPSLAQMAQPTGAA